MLQVLVNILGGITCTALGIGMLYLTHLKNGIPEEPPEPPWYEGRIIKIKWKTVTIQYVFEGHEIEKEFQKQELPLTAQRTSMKVGMPVKIFQASDRSQPFVRSVGKGTSGRESILVSLLMFAGALVFFTGNW
ncbi:MAG: hypothetical protein IJ644_01995 [Oscillospiraceae bacterium]|nr:hypothetical protein [Oscillospiraceae bacterium]